jgi:hypothetical protein
MKQAPTQRKTASTEVQPRRKGSALAVASFASYDAATPDKTRQLSNRIGTNPNSAYAQQQRVMMMWQAEDLVKNSDWISYCYALKQYCQPTSWISESPDPVLANEVTDYMRQVMKRGGINCSAMKAFSDAAHVEMPVRGDSILEAYFDESQLRFILRCADQIGELYRFINPASYGWAYGADAFNAPGLTDVNYFAGIFLSPSGENQAFKIYERGYNQMYINPHVVPAANCIYFQDNLFAGHRGVTKFAPAIQSIQKRNKIWQSGMDSMAMQSKIAAIASNSSGEPEEPAYETTTNDDGSISYIEKMSDGAVVKYQFTGDSYQFMKSEQPGGSLLQGLDYADERTCLALGFPKSMLITARDGGGAPTRFDMSRAGREIMRLRDEVYTPPLEKMAYLFIMDGINRGLLPAQAGVLKGRWHFPSLPTADAFRDDKSDVEAMRAGLTTRTAIIAKNGDGTFADVLKQGAQEAVAIQIATQDANRELVKRGYKPAIADLNIAQDTSNPSQQPQGEAPANATAAMAFDESKHPREDDGKFGEGGGGAKKEDAPAKKESASPSETGGKGGDVSVPKHAKDSIYESLIKRATPVGKNLHELSEKQVTPALRQKLYERGRPEETHAFSLRRKSDVTGRPYDAGWILKDKREDYIRRNSPVTSAPATAALAFDESKHPRADDGKFGSGGGEHSDAPKKGGASDVDSEDLKHTAGNDGWIDKNTYRFFHGTQEHKLQSIKDTGLKPPTNVNPHRWFMTTTDIQEAKGYTPGFEGNKPVVLEYRIPKEKVEDYLGKGMRPSSGGVYHGIVKPIPKEFLHTVHDVNKGEQHYSSAALADFDESKHKRANDGKFSSGNDASAHADKKSKEAHVADKGRDRGLSQRMHRDAADAHDQAAKQYSEEGKRDYSEYHEEKATEHRQFAGVDAKEKRAESTSPNESAAKTGKNSQDDNFSKSIQTRENELKGLRTNEQLFALDENGGHLGEATGMKSEVKIPQELTDKLKAHGNATLTHNHPGGTSFSMADVMYAQQANLKEIRAVGVDQPFLYILKRPKEGWPDRDTLLKEVRDSDSIIREALQSAVESGQMKYEDANKSHAHSRMLNLSFRLNLDYKRRAHE